MNQRKKKIIAISIIVIIILASVVAVYLKFYYIDTNQMNFCIGLGDFESPNEEYVVTIEVYPTEDIPRTLDSSELLSYILQNEIKAYVVGRLRWAPSIQPNGAKNWDSKNSKIIYFDRFDNLDFLVYWKDDFTVEINDEILKVPNQVFDYRRN